MTPEFLQFWIDMTANPAALLVIVVVSSYLGWWIPGPLHAQITKGLKDRVDAWKAESESWRVMATKQSAVIEQFIRKGPE